jgi:hypothetical protein
MRPIRRYIQLNLVAAALAALAGCATPERTVLSESYYPSGRLQARSQAHEIGHQLWLAERHDVTSAPGTSAGSDVSKRTMGIVGGALGGTLIGGAFGNPALGALTGTVAGSIGAAIDGRDNPSASADLGAILGAANEIERARMAKRDDVETSR